ncbi:hypothetical protein BCT06_13660 [Vibrio breoganii]|uniref:glycosyltransferase n=1 Tax=Vibrio breoganii TaxID=553239 RepID=UPI000CC9064E|nr:glycosyltransferase [Vibrio breoganii]PMO59952.1 hypothetical protein BCT06_13660 [Vibrio breoganii]
MPAYNAEKFISETIHSVLTQSFIDFELIIVDDGSTDKTKDKILEFKDNRIKYFYKNNEGISAALNYGLKKCKSDLVARLDADDICERFRLELQFKEFEKDENLILLGTAMNFIDDNGDYLGRNFVTTDRKSNLIAMKYRNPFCHPTVMFKKNKILECEGYDTNLSGLFEDHFLWSKVIKLGEARNLEIPLVSYRISVEQLTSINFSQEYISLKNKIILTGKYDLDEINLLHSLKKESPRMSIQDRIKQIRSSRYFKIYIFLFLITRSELYASRIISKIIKMKDQ